MAQWHAAVVGAGRMGSFVVEQLPPDAERTLIDPDFARAQAVAGTVGGRACAALSGCSDADLILLVLPAPAVAGAAREAAAYAKPGAAVINMATEGDLPADLAAQYPHLTFCSAKIIGHAGAMRAGAPGLVVTDAPDERTLALLSRALPGFCGVTRGDTELVPVLNTIGSREGIRAAVACRRQLARFGVPQEWADAVIRTVCAGTMRAYAEDDLGPFGCALAEKLEREAE